ncbi:MarR family transcriptional regulator [Priestia koreensis]|uniref:MarR family transcriptional regulator n=1 Tax=Priestia koreensis TaxID=284581 RepID=UPI00203FF455|nr:MarR family transcriptional regulator [Priestia koreensis]MCM3004963.1 MarR family transcriptional regulator [Priestia koreensis]
MKELNGQIKQASEVLQSFSNIMKEAGKWTQKNASSLDLNVQQMVIINTLSVHKVLTVEKLVAQLQLSKNTINTQLETIVQRGFVERTMNDQREGQLSLTDEGRKKANMSIQNASSYKAMMRALQSFSEEEKAQLLAMHARILEGLKVEE